ncbi:hypothetical protein G9A89_023337 [Geosiphon pyriformis]|nr:hypothetical protein G9A89_023337 [Geosiphon pyriformis]
MLPKNYHKRKTSKDIFSLNKPPHPTTSLSNGGVIGAQKQNEHVGSLSSPPPAHTTFSARNPVRTTARRAFPPPVPNRTGKEQKSQSLKIIPATRYAFSTMPRPTNKATIGNNKEKLDGSFYSRPTLNTPGSSLDQKEAMKFAKRRKNRVHFSISFQEFHKILAIEQEFHEGKSIVTYGRTFIRQGVLLKDPGTGPVFREVFLFNDVLITAEPLTEEKQRILLKKLDNQVIVSLTHLHIDSVDREDGLYYIEVNTGKSFYSFVFESLKERDDWFESLNQAITTRKVIVARRAKEIDLVKQNKRSNSFTFDGSLLRAWGVTAIINEKSGSVYDAIRYLNSVKSFNGTVSNVTSRNIINGGDRNNDNGVFWVPDEDASECMVCKITKFGFLVRKHHCRLCGRVICWKCSQLRELSYAKEKYLRACKDCVGADYDSNDEEEFLNVNGEFSVPRLGGIGANTQSERGSNDGSSVETRTSIMLQENNNSSASTAYYTASVNPSLSSVI